MGSLVSTMFATVAPAQSPPAPPPKVVLVPPFFQRDVRGLSRFCRSSYDQLASRKQLARLLRDHLTPDLRGTLLLSPPDDPRVSVRAKLRKSGGSMVLRWQPASAAAAHSFVEMAARLDSPGDVSFRGSYLHPGSGLGAFLVAPLAKQLSGAVAQVGVRYSSRDGTAGAVFIPRTGELDKLWLAGRLHGFTLGMQLWPGLPVRHILASVVEALSPPPPRPPPPLTGANSPASGTSAAAAAVLISSSNTIPTAAHFADLRSWLRSRSSVLLSYSPPAQAGSAGYPFTAAVELVSGGALTFSFFQHVAATRQVVNPFEEDEVVGITNYLDIGLQLTTAVGPTTAAVVGTKRPLPPSAAASSGGGATPATPDALSLAASWQVNKNWLLKARIGSEGAAAAVGARVWHAVSAYLTASVAVDYVTRTPRYGAELCVENFGPLRYERGADDVAAGRALLQRHEASPQDLANFAGRGVLVQRSASGGAAASASSSSSCATPVSLQEQERWRVAELM